MLGSRFDLAETLTEITQRNILADGLLADGFLAVQEAAGALDVGALAELDGAGLDDHCAVLELEMAEVARLVHFNNSRTSFKCPICDTRMQVSCERVLAEFGELDVKRHELECDTCGLMTLRAFHPSIGYRELPR